MTKTKSKTGSGDSTWPFEDTGFLHAQGFFFSIKHNRAFAAGV
jgi:hypothetical protein